MSMLKNIFSINFGPATCSGKSQRKDTRNSLKKFFLALCLLTTSLSASAGPLGLEQGMSLGEIQQITTLRQISPYVYAPSQLPQGSSAFEDYRLVVTPVHGLCKISAWSSVTSNRYGDDVKAKFNLLFESLSQKYGHIKTFDLLRSGSIWDEPEDWMMGLAKKERSLAAFWMSENGSVLPDSIMNIGLQTHGVDSSQALIELGYEFKNASECIGWINKQAHSSL